MKKIKAIIRLIKAKDWCLLTHNKNGQYDRMFEVLKDAKYSSSRLLYITDWLKEEAKVFGQGKIKC